MQYTQFKLPTLVLMVSSIFTYPALAQAAEATKPPDASGSTAPAGRYDKEMRQLSQAGHSAMTNISDARLAIFEGDPTIAMKLMQSAKTFLAQADKDVLSIAANTSGDKTSRGALPTLDTKIRSVPIDGQLSLADDYVMTPEKKAHVDKANESLKKGDHATGLEELRLGAIDVNYTRWWLPIAPAESHLDQAIKLANDSKLYEANLALKAIEDSVTMDSISFSDLSDTPKDAKNKS